MAKNDSFADDVIKLLGEYTENVSEKISAAADMLTKQAQKTLKEKSPVDKHKYSKRRGKYAKSWRLKRFGGDRKFRIVIHNTEYRLTHLLENGVNHHYPNDSVIPPIVHIAPVQNEINDMFFKACKKIIKEESKNG